MRSSLKSIGIATHTASRSPCRRERYQSKILPIKAPYWECLFSHGCPHLCCVLIVSPAWACIALLAFLALTSQGGGDLLVDNGHVICDVHVVHVVHVVNDARCCFRTANPAHSRSTGMHHGHWPSSARSTTHVAHLVDHASALMSVMSMVSLMSLMSMMSLMTFGQRCGHASQHVAVPWQDSLLFAPVAIEWIAASNPKRKLSWLVCRQVHTLSALT